MYNMYVSIKLERKTQILELHPMVLVKNLRCIMKAQNKKETILNNVLYLDFLYL